mgnify:CR=1 FL=1
MRNGNVEEPAEEPAHNSINCTLRNGNFKEEVTDVTMYEVLIVPCGMETTQTHASSERSASINCTLRNGNTVYGFTLREIMRINCTLRNGNIGDGHAYNAYDRINCTLRNGNMFT